MGEEKPYLCIYYRSVPAEGEKTNQKNWSDQGNWNVYERAKFVDRLDNKILTEAHTIIDIFDGKVVKTRDNYVNEENYVNAWMGKYQQKIQEAVRNYWFRQAGKKKKN